MEELMFRKIDSLSLAADAAKQNEDAFGGDEGAAVVLDGATMLGPGLMPGPSDAAWIAQFGARRLIAHLKDEEPKKALRRALSDTEKSFLALRRHEPQEPWQTPCASLMLVAERTSEGAAQLEFLWFGDCAALVESRGKTIMVGDTLQKRIEESERASKLARERNLSPAAATARPEFLGQLRAVRNRINIGSHWLFTPDKRAAAHAKRKLLAAELGAHILLASDGFLALLSDYGAYSADGLMAAAKAQGLGALGAELRAIEEDDPAGNKFPRFKKNDDATAVLLEIF
jgi:hypothetical protein